MFVYKYVYIFTSSCIVHERIRSIKVNGVIEENDRIFSIYSTFVQLLYMNVFSRHFVHFSVTYFFKPDFIKMILSYLLLHHLFWFWLSNDKIFAVRRTKERNNRTYKFFYMENENDQFLKWKTRYCCSQYEIKNIRTISLYFGIISIWNKSWNGMIPHTFLFQHQYVKNNAKC